MIAAHAPVVIGHMAPHREQPVHALLLVAEHGVRHVGGLTRKHHHQQRMLGAICVPQGEYGVIVESLGAVYVLVKSAVAPVDIHIYRRIYHGVVI